MEAFEIDLSPLKHMPLQKNRFHFSISPEGLPQEFAFDPFLFLQKKHLQTQSEDELLFFQLLDQKTAEIVTHLPVFVNENGVACSPGKAPFGSIQFKDQLQEEVLAEFLTQTKRYLFEVKNCRIFKIKSYPFAYAPSESAVLTELLLKQEFKISHSEINHHIAVNAEAFENNLHPSARRRLFKCLKNEFIFREERDEQLPEVWDFINFCRKERKYEPPLPLQKLTELFQEFPAHFRTFTIRQAGKLAAATIAVQVNKQILYNFYPANPVSFNAFSPIVLLTQGLYQVCQKEEISLLDLGTSNLPEGPNFPLIAFKKHLGGKPSLKLSFEIKQ